MLFKRLLEVRPADLLLPVLDGLPEQEFRFFRLRDKETLRTRAGRPLDGVVEDLRGSRSLYHLEFEAIPQSDTGRRVFEHATLLHLSLPKRPLRSIVYYLTPGRQRRRPVDRYDRYAEGELQSAFRFHVVVLWEIVPEVFLQTAAPALWVMVPLCQGATVAHVRRAHRQIAARFEKGATQIELDTALYTLASVQFEQAALAGIFKESMLMESWAIKNWMDKGRAEGIVQGERRGIAKGRAEGRAKGERMGMAKGERMGMAKGERMGMAKGERMGMAKGERMGMAKGERMGRIEGLQAACRSAIAAKLPRVPLSAERILGRIDNEKMLLRLVGQLAAASDARAVRAVLQQLR